VKLKFLWIAIGIFSVLIIVGCGAKAPVMVLETEILDLGEVVNGTVVTRELAVRNEGTAPLIVDAVSTSCGCTKASIEPMTIPAGGNGTLTIIFDSGAHGPEEVGEIIRQVFISAQDLAQPETMIEFRADVLPPVD
jgi:hypothetical protein